jgi:hypothetical protein
MSDERRLHNKRHIASFYFRPFCASTIVKLDYQKEMELGAVVFPFGVVSQLLKQEKRHRLHSN